MSARHSLAELLSPLLPADFQIVDHPEDLARIDDNTIAAVVMIERNSFAPAANALGSYVDEFELHAISTLVDQQGAGEDALEEVAGAVAKVLNAATWLVWTRATRSTYNGAYPAYTFAITTITKLE